MKTFIFRMILRKYNRDYFNAEIQEIDIFDSESPKMINQWVEEKTNGKIEEIIDSPLDPDLVTVLINAIYFKGDWKYEFDESQTEDRTFYLKDGTYKGRSTHEVGRKISLYGK